MRTDFYAHVPLPQHYIKRTDILTELCSTLLGEQLVLVMTSAVVSSSTLLHGIGGIGKTVVARAICDDPLIQERFSDGILWVTLGQTPNLVARLREWIEGLGETVHENVPTIDHLKSTLQGLLEERSCLLIIDDVWDKEHLDAFVTRSSRSRVLVTTRNLELARTIQATVQPIPPMTVEQAIALLDEWAETHSASDMALKIRAVDSVGRLPLAVRLAGAQLRDQDIKNWLTRFETGSHIVSALDDTEHILHHTFERSLVTLNATERHLYAALAIFKEDDVTPEVAIAQLWYQMAQFDEAQTASLLRALESRALLQSVESKSRRGIILHDLLRDMMTAELDNQGLIAAHRYLLAAYKKQGQAWAAILDDGYLYDHLAYHLNAIADYQELASLFADQNWMYARVRNDQFEYDGYLRDLGIAWQSARAIADADQLSPQFVDCVRYSLIQTSINSLAGNYEPKLLVQALHEGVWSATRAVSTARKVPQADHQVATITALLGTDYLDNAQRADLLTVALKAVPHIGLYDDRVRGLKSLAPYLYGDFTDHALDIALESVPKLQRLQMLEAVAPILAWNRATLERIIGVTGSNKHLTRWALSIAAPYLAGSLVDYALDVMLRLLDNWSAISFLTRILPYVSSHRQQDAIQAALSSINQIEDNLLRHMALTRLLPFLHEDQREEAYQALASIKPLSPFETLTLNAPNFALLLQHANHVFESREMIQLYFEQLQQLLPTLIATQKNTLLSALLTLHFSLHTEHPKWRIKELLPHLTPDLLGRALQTAHALPNEETQLETLPFFMEYLGEKQKGDLLRRIWALAAKYPGSTESGDAVATVAPYLTREEDFRTALDVLRPVKFSYTDHYYGTALHNLAPHLPESLLPTALELYLSIRHDHYRNIVLETLGPRLRGNLLDHALSSALQIRDAVSQAKALSVIAPILSYQDKQRSLEITLEGLCDHETFRAEALGAWLPYLTGDLRAQAVEAIVSRDWGHDLYRLLKVALPDLTGDILERALRQALNQITTTRDALEVLLPKLSSQQIQYVLQELMQIEDVKRRVYAIALVIPHLPSEQKDQLISSYFEEAMTNQEDQAYILGSLASCLKGDLAHQALKIAFDIRSDAQMHIIMDLLPNLDAEAKRELLASTLSLSPSQSGWRFTRVLMEVLTEDELQQALNNARQLEPEHRASLLGQIYSTLPDTFVDDGFNELLPLVETENGLQALLTLLPRMDDLHVRQTIDLILNSQDHFMLSRADALLRTLSFLHDEFKVEIIHKIFSLAAKDRSPDFFYSSTILPLVPHVPPVLLSEFLAFIANIPSAEYRAKAFVALYQHLPNDTELLQMTRTEILNHLHDLQAASRSALLRFLTNSNLWNAVFLPERMLSDVAHQIFEICDDWQWL